MRIKARHRKMIGNILESAFIGIGLVGWMKGTWFDFNIAQSVFMSLVATGMTYMVMVAYKTEKES